MGFLSERVMLVKFKGETSGTKSLPGGGPQGTLLGLLLFLVLINFCGFDNDDNIGEQITNPKKNSSLKHFMQKLFDHLTIAESFNIKEPVIPNPNRLLPDTYHARLGQKLDPQKSQTIQKTWK